MNLTPRAIWAVNIRSVLSNVVPIEGMRIKIAKDDIKPDAATMKSEFFVNSATRSTMAISQTLDAKQNTMYKKHSLNLLASFG